MVGSPYWMAPEVLRDEPYNEKVGALKKNLYAFKMVKKFLNYIRNNVLQPVIKSVKELVLSALLSIYCFT